MIRCPKCRSTRISGPTYDRMGHGGEVLRYQCQVCGYSETRDAADKEPAETEAHIR